MTEELQRTVAPLQEVWRMADYHDCLDASKESVLEALTEYDSATLNTDRSSA